MQTLNKKKTNKPIWLDLQINANNNIGPTSF